MLSTTFGRAFSPVLAVSCACLFAACNSPTGGKPQPEPEPEPEPAGITIVSGALATDSAAAILSAPLVVQVRDSAGELRAGINVHFQASSSNLNGFDRPTALLGPMAGGSYAPAMTATTDATGRAVARVRLGMVAGPASIAVTVPTLGLAETASFIVTPGAPARLDVAPRDTAVYAGDSYTLRVAALDQWGNAISNVSPTIASDAPEVASVSGASVTAQALGRTEVVIETDRALTVVGVSVVPQGTLLAADNNGIYIFGMDGSGYRRVARGEGSRSPRWFPDGETFVFTHGTFGHAQVSDLDGALRPLVQRPNHLQAELWTHPSRDGQWVYFGGYDSIYRGYPHRVRTDGTDLELVPGFVPDDRTQSHPSPSPAGDRVAYFREAIGNSRDVTLRILNLQTGRIELQDVPGHSPEWSHGDSIAYLDVRGSSVGSIRLMSSSGQGHRMVGTGTSYTFGIDWSPTDEWIVAHDAEHNRLEVIRVATGERIPLPFTTGLSNPAWRP